VLPWITPLGHSAQRHAPEGAVGLRRAPFDAWLDDVSDSLRMPPAPLRDRGRLARAALRARRRLSGAAWPRYALLALRKCNLLKIMQP
jgi:hypothetical protein